MWGTPCSSWSTIVHQTSAVNVKCANLFSRCQPPLHNVEDMSVDNGGQIIPTDLTGGWFITLHLWPILHSLTKMWNIVRGNNQTHWMDDWRNGLHVALFALTLLLLLWGTCQHVQLLLFLVGFITLLWASGSRIIQVQVGSGNIIKHDFKSSDLNSSCPGISHLNAWYADMLSYYSHSSHIGSSSLSHVIEVPSFYFHPPVLFSLSSWRK